MSNSLQHLKTSLLSFEMVILVLKKLDLSHLVRGLARLCPERDK
jgi:hypothetical protein